MPPAWHVELTPALSLPSAENLHDFRSRPFTTVSGHPIGRLYGPADPACDDLSLPGDPPYTRGIHPTMYRGRLWTMRQFAGFGAAADTNARFRYLLSQGQSGLSVAFDLPTLMGYDSDHALARREVGKCGVAISSLADMETLFEGIPLAGVTTSMTINSPAACCGPCIWRWRKNRARTGNALGDPAERHPEGIHRAEGIHFSAGTLAAPGNRHHRVWRAAHAKFNPISISGYHIREAGSTAIQELAFTLRDGIEYVECHTARLGGGRVRPAAVVFL